MQLFDIEADPAVNYLPYEGTVHYYGKVLSSLEADHYFEMLMKNIAWENDQAIIFGRKIITKRKVAWYGDRGFEYTYSNINKYALPWTIELIELKALVEKLTGETFNSCLLNLYHSGEEGMAWHSDAETALKRNGAIGSLSLGTARKFSFKHKKTKHTVNITLEHGSLLVMKGETQSHWLHCLPTTKKILTPRINLTFRCINQH